MSRRNSAAWRWRRWIARETESLWLARMEARGATDWLIIEKPARVRLCVEAYFLDRREAEALVPAWGGGVKQVPAKVPAQKPGPPIRVSDNLEITHKAPNPQASRGQLHIPYGMAFGSGEHATTLMLLRALARRRDWTGQTVLDLGTGSGILALTARKLGARAIVATDFDPEAVRTARQNEKLNFKNALVRWACSDVKKLPSRPGHSLIVANLFSGILVEAAARIAKALRKNGELWISGILRSQQQDVADAYRRAGLQLIQRTTRGKWIMQQWRR